MTRAIATTIFGLGLFILGGADGSPVLAQESPRAGTAPPGQAPAEILLRLTEPARPRPAESVTGEDLRTLPKPRPDRFPGNVRVYVVGDPRCEPGEDLFDPGWNRPRSRRH